MFDVELGFFFKSRWLSLVIDKSKSAKKKKACRESKTTWSCLPEFRRRLSSFSFAACSEQTIERKLHAAAAGWSRERAAKCARRGEGRADDDDGVDDFEVRSNIVGATERAGSGSRLRRPGLKRQRQWSDADVLETSEEI